MLGLLLGLLAMHGLSSSHDQAPVHPSAALPAAASADAPDDDTGYGAPEHQPASHSMADMAELCLAVLTGAAALALLLLAPLRALPAQRVAVLPTPHGAADRTSAPRRPPDLSVLCVLRT